MMYNILLLIHYIGIIVSLLALAYVCAQKASKMQVLIVIIFQGVIINLVGYTFEMQSVTKEQAIMAVKFLYCGKPYILLGMFLFVMIYCGVKMPKWLTVLLGICHIGLSALVFTCEKSTLFYSSIDFVQTGLFPHLILGHGILYYLYMLVTLLYLLVMIAACCWKFRTADTKIEKRRLICMATITAISLAGLLILKSGITEGYDTTATTYVLSALILTYALVKCDLMDPLVIAKDTIIDDFIDGVLVLDDKGNPIYTNTQLRQIFPGLGKDRLADIKHIMELCKSKEKLKVGKNIYEVHEKDIIKDELLLGRIYLIGDVTESYNYMIKLEEQKELADKANMAKSDFLARMSHEIRTPINSVLGMNEMILRESTEPEIKKYAFDVKTSANSLLGIINDILDLSKIESGKMEVRPVEYELGSLLNDLVNMIYVRAKEKNLKFQVLVEKTLPSRLFGDDVRIRQILVNLLTNAVKYTPEGTVTLSVSGTVYGDYVVMHYEVRDTGIGIKEEDLSELFVSFQRIEEDRNRNIEGTGLGMVIVQNLLTKMDSYIEVDSVYGKGSTFYFDLVQPIIDREPIGNFQERLQYVEGEYNYQSSFTAPKAKILVIDDNDINRSVFRNLLKQTKVQVTDVNSGAECLKLVAKEHFDLIFMDHMMPGMDGVETLKRMRQMEDNCCKNVPVIILTANAVTGAKEYYLKNGFSDFLSKPIVPEKLELMIQKYLPKEYIGEDLESDRREGEKEQQQGASGFEELPAIEEFDWAYAKMHFPTAQLLRETLKSMYVSLEKDKKQLEEWFPLMEQPEVLKDYQVLVHAIKSTCAAVGALLLSKLARLAEVAAIEQNVDKLSKLHPILMEEIDKHRKRLEVLLDLEHGEAENGNDLQVDDVHWKKLLEELENALKEWDYDAADSLMEKLSAYKYEDKIQELMDKLKMQVLNIQAAAAIQTIEEINKVSNS